jgi:integrase
MVPARWRLPLRVLAQTGMRVGELEALTWGDIDETGSRFE